MYKVMYVIFAGGEFLIYEALKIAGNDRFAHSYMSIID